MFMIKLFGIVLIMISATLAGMYKSRSLVSRSQKLSFVLEGIDMLYEYIQQESCELDQAIKNSFLKCGFLSFQNGKLFYSDSDLKKEERREIEEFFALLGTSAKKTECDRITNFKLKIKRFCDAAENDVLKKCNVYRTFGVCIGLVIGILLI